MWYAMKGSDELWFALAGKDDELHWTPIFLSWFRIQAIANTIYMFLKSLRPKHIRFMQDIDSKGVHIYANIFLIMTCRSYKIEIGSILLWKKKARSNAESHVAIQAVEKVESNGKECQGMGLSTWSSSLAIRILNCHLSNSESVRH